MTKNDIINIIAKEKWVESIITNIAGNTDDMLRDLAQDIYIDLISKEDEKVVQLYNDNQLKFFITRMVVNNVRSKTSPYWLHYKKFTNNMNEIEGDIVDE